MPAKIADLVRDKASPICIKSDSSITEALSLMIEHDYSQLPVVDDTLRPIGLITSDSILRALHHFKVTTDKLFVQDAMIKKPTEYNTEDDLFDLLDDLNQDDVVHVIDSEGKLIGIVTAYDATSYLRQRSQDIMYVRDIEEMIKSYIQQTFLDSTGRFDEEKQQKAISEITPSNDQLRSKFFQAVRRYLEQNGEQHQVNQQLLQEIFDKVLANKPKPKTFDKLTLHDYIELFTHKNRWPSLEKVFSLDREAVRHLLFQVKATRNNLAHFRDNISVQQRQELIFAKEWLARYEHAIRKAFSSDPAPVTDPDHISLEGLPNNNIQTTKSTFPKSTGDLPSVVTGRYVNLSKYLQQQAANTTVLELTFNDIDELLGEYKLPQSARQYRTC